jgi:uncharacterized membrane protein YhaH (DUF805 family)
MEWMILPLKRYAQFGGRARRKEFWMWVLFYLLVTAVLTTLDSWLGLGGGGSSYGPGAQSGPGMMSYGAGASVHGGLLTGLFALAVLIPNLAVAVRRLHDTDRSGWWLLLMVVPYGLGFVLMLSALAGGMLSLIALGSISFLVGAIGAIVLIVFYCLPGTSGPNRFGPDPLEDTPEHLAETFE